MNKRSIFISILLLCVLVLSACSTASSTSTTTDSATSSSQPSDSIPAVKVNLNTASDDDFLAAVPGLGNRMVREFKEYRPYISIQQFRQEIGKYVDDSQVTTYENYVYVPIAINEADAETLQQIPGLSASEAETLVSARPFASIDDFLSALRAYVSADQLETAKTYLGEN